MKNQRSYIKLATGLASALLAGWVLTGCSQTTAPEPNVIQRAEGEKPAVPTPSGFLGTDYSLLQPAAPGSEQKALLAYTNPNANFASYSKLMIAPVTFWADSDSRVSAEDQQKLCDYFYDVLQTEFSKNFTIVNEPGPGV